ncbi:MAG: glycosyltransferase, partial [Flavisolibacter sp.]
RKLLEDLILQRGLSPNIQLAGELSYPEVLNAMKRSRVFLHTSSFEGFGCVCIEALKAGAHVISFSKPMYKEIRHWYIAQSPDEMKLKAIKILQDMATAYEPVSGFNMEDTVRQMMRLFRTT